MTAREKQSPDQTAAWRSSSFDETQMVAALRALQAEVQGLKGLRGEVRRLAAAVRRASPTAAAGGPRARSASMGASPPATTLLTAFLRDCATAAPAGKVGARALYDAFLAFCARYDVPPVSEIIFAAALRPLLGPSRRTYLAGRNVNAYAGIALVDNPAMFEATRDELASAVSGDHTTLLYGFREIAAYLGQDEQSVRAMADRDELPLFRIGRTVCANISALKPEHHQAR